MISNTFMYNRRKAIEVLNYFASKQNDKEIDKLKALKLLWLADRYHARQYGRTITSDTCCAMQYGTVPSCTKNYLDSLLQTKNVSVDENCLVPVGEYTYKSVREPNLKVFSKTDLKALDTIYSTFGEKNSKDLVEYTHKLTEWKRFEQSINDPSKKSSYKINIKDIFQNINDEVGIFNDDEELLEITEELLLRN